MHTSKNDFVSFVQSLSRDSVRVHVVKVHMVAIEQALKSGSYDAVLGDREASVGTYREYVVFEEDLIYPEYVVLYKRVRG